MTKKSHLYFILFLFSLSALNLAGCKKEEPDPDPQPQEVILSDETRILDANTLALISQVDTSEYTITFTGSTPQTEALKSGDIVVSGVHDRAPFGFMRRVVSVSKNANTTTLTTQPALLSEVLLQGSISGSQEKMGYKQIKSIQTEDGVELMPSKSSDLLGFNLSFEKALGDQAKAYGSLYFEMGFHFALNVSFPASVDYFKASTVVEQKGVIGMKATGNWSGKKIKIASVEFTPWTLMVGPLPLVFVPQASLILDAEAGQVTATVETFASEEFARELGLKYNGDSWSLINQWEPAPTADLMWPALEGNANFEVNCGPRTALKLYGAAGPYFDLLAYSTLDASVSGTNYNLVFTIGLEANAGVEVNAFGFTLLDYGTNLFRKEIKRLTLNNEPLPAGIRITTPPEGALLISGNSVEVNATVGGQPNGGVKFYLDEILLYTDPEAPWGFMWNITQPKGSHVLKAVAEVGAETLTHEITLTIGSGTWSQINLGNVVNEGEELTAVYFISDKVGWITGKKSTFSGDYGFVLHTTNGGLTWQRQAEFPRTGNFANGYAYDILMLGPNYGMITGQFDGGIMQTDNGGIWLPRREFWSPDSSYSWLPSPLGVTASKDGAILLHEEYSLNLSTDGGVSWYDANTIQVSPYLAGQIQKTAFGSGQTGYMATYDAVEGSRVYRTSDNGFSWQESALPVIASRFQVRDLAAFGHTHCWLAGYSHSGDEEDIILYTHNGGQTWNEANIALPNGIQRFEPETIWFVDEYSGFAAGRVINMSGVKTGILFTEDGGQNWSEVPATTGSPYGSIRDMFFHGSADGYAVGYTENTTTYEKEPLLMKYSISKVHLSFPTSQRQNPNRIQ